MTPRAAALVASALAAGLLLSRRSRRVVDIDDAPGGAPVGPIKALGPQARDALWGPLPFAHLGDGQIEIDPTWLSQNITTEFVPELGRAVSMHKGAIGPFKRWLRRSLDEGLIAPGERLDTGVVPRLARRRGQYLDAPSSHAYGTAWDLNPALYPEGDAGDWKIWRMAQIAAEEGIGWLGLADDPDPMHFEVVVRSG